MPRVGATVPYTSLFGALIFADDLNLVASAQSPVMGIMTRFWPRPSGRFQKLGGPAAEFALVLPLLHPLFLFGIIDVGRLMRTWNQAEKATADGCALRSRPISFRKRARQTFSYAINGGIPQGDLVPAASFPPGGSRDTSPHALRGGGRLSIQK